MTSLFLLYINDLQIASDIRDPVMFADDANLFYWSKDIDSVFLKVNELQKVNEWFVFKNPSLNVQNSKYSFFHKLYKKDDIRLVLPKMNINNLEITRTESIKFLGIFLDKVDFGENSPDCPIRKVLKKLLWLPLRIGNIVKHLVQLKCTFSKANYWKKK